MGKKDRSSKHLRQEARKQQARRKLLYKRLRQILILAGLGLIAGLIAFDQSGTDEIADAEVIRTSTYQHLGSNPPHSHTRATLSIEGQTEVNIDRADGLVRGQSVPVYVRRGRLTGWVSFQDLVTPVGGS